MSIRSALQDLVDTCEEPPESNCSCHINPPCNDCVNWSGLRSALSYARQVLLEEDQIDKVLSDANQCVVELLVDALQRIHDYGINRQIPIIINIAKAAIKASGARIK